MSNRSRFGPHLAIPCYAFVPLGSKLLPVFNCLFNPVFNIVLNVIVCVCYRWCFARN